MKNATLYAVAMAVVLALPAAAKEVAGAQFPDSIQVQGKTLKLNGAGLRKKAIFKVYVAGFYVETPSQDPAQLVASEQIKRMRILTKRDLSKDQVAGAIIDGFKKNAADKLPALQQRLDSFTQAIPDVKEGQELLLTYVPGKGTEIQTSAGQSQTVAGKDFADALFSVWLGPHAVDSGLREGLLGKE